MLDTAYHILYVGLFIVLGLCVLACLIRSIKGPRVADRVVAGNMIGTAVIMIITVLSGYLGEGYLIDVCMLYAMISFVSVVVLSKVYSKAHQEEIGVHDEDLDTKEAK